MSSPSKLPTVSAAAALFALCSLCLYGSHRLLAILALRAGDPGQTGRINWPGLYAALLAVSGVVCIAVTMGVLLTGLMPEAFNAPDADELSRDEPGGPGPSAG